MRIKIIAFAFFALMVSCNKDNSNPEDLVVTPPSNLTSNSEWAINLFKKINEKEDSKENLFLSPLSIYTALGMAYNGADADTKIAMEKAMALKKPDIQAFNKDQKQLLDYLTNVDKEVTMNVANSIWVDKNFSVLPNFITQNKTYYNAEVNKEDFRNPKTLGLINNWVSEKTNKKIPTILDNISDNEVLFLINAVYFNGNWTTAFDSKGTHELPFTLGNGSQMNVPTMSLTSKLNYMENNLLQAVDLPYGKGKYSMTILLPQSDKNISNIMADLNATNLNSWLSKMQKTEDVILKLPRFKFGYKKTLNEVLIDMGMGEAFDDRADFSKISNTEKLEISQVLHKTYIDVTETGTEAAAVTSIGFETTSIPQGNYMNVNRPFIFMIREASTNSIVFIGKVTEPKQ